MFIEVVNASPHTFVLDGQYLPHGEWRSDPRAPIAPRSTTTLELAPAPVLGLCAAIWFVGGEDRDVYVSLTAMMQLGPATFSCFAGVPPANLKLEAKRAPRLDASSVVRASDGSCEWTGSAEHVKVTIPEEVASFAPGTAAACRAAGVEQAGQNWVVVSEGDEADAANFFAQTRPCDATDGLKRGLSNAFSGVATGLATAVAAPIFGARQEGAMGFAKGLGMGLVGGTAMTIGGVACGSAQICRGLFQVPAAHRGRREEKIWEQETGRWVDVNLCELEVRIEREMDEDGAPKAADEAEEACVKETEYYDLLRVAPGASATDIKKAYYKEARQCHPDKNPGDAAATAKFQKLSEVYQVLADPKSRNKYDREGHDGVAGQKTATLDPAAFFSLLFGSERFVPWTGELHLAMQFDHFAKATVAAAQAQDDLQDDEKMAKQVARRQLRREVMCAVHLREKTERFVYGRDVEGFEEQMRLEAHDLANAQFGPELLAALGEIFWLRAEIYLANELHGRCSVAKRLASAKYNLSMVRHNLNLVGSLAGSALQVRKAYSAATTAHANAERKRTSEISSAGGAEPEPNQMDEESAKILESAIDEALPTFLHTAWSYVVRDIDSTMKSVGRKFLQDKSVPWQIRVRRAQALQRLGEIFAAASQAEAAQGERSRAVAAEEAKARLQEAIVGAMKEK